MLPAKLCHQIVDLYSWAFAFLGAMALIYVGLKNDGTLPTSPIYWIGIGAVAVQLLAAVFRGLPLPWRYAVFAGTILTFTVCTAIVLGITPNWCFLVIMLLSSTGMLFGVRVGLVASGILCAIHVLIAWGWTQGYFPVKLPGRDVPAVYMDFREGDVWARVLIMTAGLLAMLQVVMNQVLRSLNAALTEANSALQKLAAEQESRARAEEARIKAEHRAREAQKFDALGRLAGGVAHDFNNKLCVMKCWSSLVLEVTKEPIVKEAMAEIRRATENAEQLTKHLLAFSRSEPAQRESVDLADLVRLEGKTLGRLLPKDIAIVVEAGAAVRVRMNRGQVQEIILNLAINARDAMPHGGRLTISIGTVTLDNASDGLPPGVYARLEVSDNGSGMDEATQAHIFEPFFTTKTAGYGTGLGLSMAYGLVTGAGGSIRVWSKPGLGSRFLLHLPVATGTDIQSEPPLARITTPTRCRVLVTEDQPEIRLLVERILTGEGFPVTLAPDCDAALAALAVPGGKFGLLILDGIMTGPPVSRVIEQLRVHHPDCKVIIASGYTRNELQQRDGPTGLHHHLAKPFDAGQLRAAVNEILGKPAAG